jgi:hypothetical protein
MVNTRSVTMIRQGNGVFLRSVAWAAWTLLALAGCGGGGSAASSGIDGVCALTQATWLVDVPEPDLHGIPAAL